MSHESFRRPDKRAGTRDGHSPAPPQITADDVEVVHETGAPKGSRRRPPSDRPLRRVPVSATVTVAIAALLAGVAGGTFFINDSEPEPIAITLDTFPREVLERERDDIRLRENGTAMDLERLDTQLQDQLVGFRQAYGGEGATLTYQGFSLTIVNGRLAAPVPLQPSPASDDVPWLVTLRSEDTLCVSLDPPSVQEPDAAVDGNKDVFYFLERGRFDATTECILFDSERNISLRLAGSGWRKRTAQSAKALHEELVALHDTLIG